MLPVGTADPGRRLQRSKAVLRGKIAMPDSAQSYGWYYGGWYGCYCYDWYGGDDVVQVGGDKLAFRRWIPQYGPNSEYVDAYQSLYIVDLSNPDAPNVASTVITHDPPRWWGNMRAVGDTLYTTHYEWLQNPAQGRRSEYFVKYYLDRIDLTDPPRSRIGSKINVPGMLVGGSETDPNIIYTIDYRWYSTTNHGANEFDVLKLSGDKAYLQSAVQIPGWVGNTFVRGNKAYMSVQQWVEGSNYSQSYVRLLQLDISQPKSLVPTISKAEKGWGWLLGVEGDRASGDLGVGRRWARHLQALGSRSRIRPDGADARVGLFVDGAAGQPNLPRQRSLGRADNQPAVGFARVVTAPRVSARGAAAWERALETAAAVVGGAGQEVHGNPSREARVVESDRNVEGLHRFVGALEDQLAEPGTLAVVDTRRSGDRSAIACRSIARARGCLVGVHREVGVGGRLGPQWVATTQAIVSLQSWAFEAPAAGPSNALSFRLSQPPLSGSVHLALRHSMHWALNSEPASSKSTDTESRPFRCKGTVIFPMMLARSVVVTGSPTQVGTDVELRAAHLPANALTVTTIEPTGNSLSESTVLCPGFTSISRSTLFGPATSTWMQVPSSGAAVMASSSCPVDSPF